MDVLCKNLQMFDLELNLYLVVLSPRRLTVQFLIVAEIDMKKKFKQIIS